VLRLRPGSPVRVFDGCGGEWEASVEAITRKGVRLHLGGPAAPLPEPALPIRLALSALKGDRMEWVIQKATELGATEIAPIITIRTDAAARPALRGTRQERWEKVAAGAAEQCGRATVPRIAPTRRLEELLLTPFDGERLILREPPAAPPLGSRPRPGPAGVWLLIGPEGGWEILELESALAAGFAPVSLGPRILRAETAAVAAVTAAGLLWGDLG
jgi:16S rRNA (uracil1498-N3)-methyltransferase